jgi:hypothetical protein
MHAAGGRTHRIPLPYCRRTVQTRMVVRRSFRGGPVWRGVGAVSRAAAVGTTRGCAGPATAAGLGAATARGIGAGSMASVKSRQQSGQQSAWRRGGCGVFSLPPAAPEQLQQQSCSASAGWASVSSWATGSAARRNGQHSPPTQTTMLARVPSTTNTRVHSASNKAGRPCGGLLAALVTGTSAQGSTNQDSRSMGLLANQCFAPVVADSSSWRLGAAARRLGPSICAP